MSKSRWRFAVLAHSAVALRGWRVMVEQQAIRLRSQGSAPFGERHFNFGRGDFVRVVDPRRLRAGALHEVLAHAAEAGWRIPHWVSIEVV